MINKQSILGVLFILSTLIISSCGTSTAEPTTARLATRRPLLRGGRLSL